MHKCVLEGSRRAKGVAWLLAGRRTIAGVVYAKDVLVTRRISHYLVDRLTCHIVPTWMQKDGFALTDVQCAQGETPPGESPGPVWRCQGPPGNDLHYQRRWSTSQRTVQCLAPKSAECPVGQETCLLFCFSWHLVTTLFGLPTSSEPLRDGRPETV